MPDLDDTEFAWESRRVSELFTSTQLEPRSRKKQSSAKTRDWEIATMIKSKQRRPMLEILEDRLAPAFYVGTNSENRPVEFEVRNVSGVPTFNRFITITETTANDLLPDGPIHRLNLVTNSLNEVLVVSNTFGNFTHGPQQFIPNVGESQNHVFGTGIVSADGKQITLPYRIERLGGGNQVIGTFEETLTANLAGTTDLSITDGQGSTLSTENLTVRVDADSRFDFRFRADLVEEISDQLANEPNLNWVAQFDTTGEAGWSLNESQLGQINGTRTRPTLFNTSNFSQDFVMTLFTASTLRNGDTFSVTFTAKRAADEPFGLADQAIASIRVTFAIGDPPTGDAQVRIGNSEAFKGAGAFQNTPTGSQTARQIIPQGLTGKYQIRVQNTASTARTFFVRRQEDITPGFNVRYRFAGVDITGLFVAGGFTTPNLQPGTSAIIEAEITPNANTLSGAEKEVTFKVFPNSTTAEVFDAVAIEAVAGLIVTTRGDSEDLIANDGVLDSDAETEGQQISLRDAIKIANQLAGTQTITFNILDLPAIALTRPLPTITDKIVIDGTTQPGTNLVELDGTAISRVLSPNRGLALTKSGTIKGMFIHSFPNAGINVNIAGDLAARRAEEVIIDGNVISKNGTGLELNDTNYRIVNNKIGTNPSGTAALPNDIGIHLKRFARAGVTGTLDVPSIQIGEENAGNLISGNNGIGILVDAEVSDDSLFPATRSNFVKIAHNKIGTDITGQNRLGGQTEAAVVINESQVEIRNNIISGNDGQGILFNSGAIPLLAAPFLPNTINDVTIEDNLIGVAADRVTALSNQHGILVGEKVALIRDIRIGRLDPATGQVSHGNIIANNQFDGISSNTVELVIAGNEIFANQESGIEFTSIVAGGFAIIQGNRIGTDASGADRGNGVAGIFAEVTTRPSSQGLTERIELVKLADSASARIIIGGLSTAFPLSFGELGEKFKGPGNIIAFNGKGVIAGNNALILGNSIFDNDAEGIESTAVYDNARSSSPEILEVSSLGGSTTVRGRVALPAGARGNRSRLLLQFYANTGSSAAAEGKTFIAERVLPLAQTASGGVAEFFVELPPAQFDILTMTATIVTEGESAVLTTTSGNEQLSFIESVEFTSAFSLPAFPGQVVDTDQDSVGDTLESQLQSQLNLPNINGVPFALEPAAVIVPTTRANGQLSLEQAIALIETNQRPLKNVKSVPVATTADAEPIATAIILPETVRQGFGMSFEVELDQPGSVAEAKFQLPNDFLLKRIVKMLPDGSFVDITNDLGVTIEGGIVTFTLIDGGPFDGDLLVNGRVKDPIIFADVNETDLALSVTAPQSPSGLAPNQNAIFNLRIANIGQQLAALPTAVSDPLPANLTFVNASDGGVFDPVTRRVTWVLDGSLAPGSSKAFNFTVRPTSAGPLSFTVTMQQNPFLIDTLTSNDSARVNATVIQPGQITVTQSGSRLSIVGDAGVNHVKVELGHAGPRTVRVSSTDAQINGTNTVLTFTGITVVGINTGAGDDVITVSGTLGPNTTVGINGNLGVDRLIVEDDVNMVLTNTQLTARGIYFLAGIDRVTLQGGAGNNTLNALGFTLGPVILNGGAGNDILIGTGLSDVLNGGAGDDVLRGLGGNDLLDGGEGSDQVLDAGNVNFILKDTQLVGLGTDTLTSIERARLIGGVGNNVITLDGWTGQAILDGGAGVDRVVVISDTDMTLTNTTLTRTGFGTVTLVGIDAATLRGGVSNNKLDARTTTRPVILEGGDGNDELLGGVSNDVLRGGNGDDVLRGFAGNDVLDGGAGVNVLDGGTGQNGVVFHGTAGNDDIRVAALSGGQLKITMNGVVHLLDTTGCQTVFVFAGAGNDRVVMDRSAGSRWRGEFHGQDGDDVLVGGDLSDALFGGAGRDTLDGAGALDWIDGGDDADLIWLQRSLLDRLVPGIGGRMRSAFSDQFFYRD
jgi:Ca2+-binding RTX toxin-like protein